MKLVLSTILLICLVHICNAQNELPNLKKRITITSNNPQADGSSGLIFLFNQLIVCIYTNKEDRLNLENNDNEKPGQEKYIDFIEFYGQDIKLVIPLEKEDQPLEINTNSFLTGRYLPMLFDKSDFYNVNDLEYQIISKGKLKDSTNNWQRINLLPQDSVGYILYSNISLPVMKPGLEATINIRSKRDLKVFSTINITRKELKPHKVMEFHYASDNQNYDRLLLLKDEFIKKADSVYENQLKNGKVYLYDSMGYQQDSRLIWFFARIDKDLPDSSLRFSLQANGKDWVVREGITGHLLLLDNLKAGNDYTLKIWYALQPENSETFHFNLPPYWYNRLGVQLAFVLLILGLIFLIVRSILKKQNLKNALRLQQAQNAFASVRAQLNPHFVFNALNSIQALMNTNNVDGANDYLSRFSKLLRTSLQPNYQGMVPLKTELELLQQYIELEQLRMPFTYTTQIEPSLDIHAVEIPGMLLQPLAENAIKHGLQGAADPKLTCEVLVQHGNLIITIKNNGYPLKQKMNNGVGLKIVEEKLEILNRCYPGTNAAHQLSTIDSLTTVTITLHQWLK